MIDHFLLTFLRISQCGDVFSHKNFNSSDFVKILHSFSRSLESVSTFIRDSIEQISIATNRDIRFYYLITSVKGEKRRKRCSRPPCGERYAIVATGRNNEVEDEREFYSE